MSGRRLRGGLVSGSPLTVFLLLACAAGAAPPPEDDPDAPAPGLVASFSGEGADAPAAVRVVDDLAARWGPGSPDARVPADRFRGRYEGTLLIQSPGAHRFFARTDGSVRLSLGGKVVLEGDGAVTGQAPVELAAGLTPIVLEYRHARGEARLAIDWEGPGFGREPLPARLLFHESGDGPRPDRFEEGRRQADRLGCANCHAVLDLPRHPHVGPPLTDAGPSIAPGWLDAWLGDPSRVRPRSRMPAFGRGLAPGEVADLAAFLASVAPRPKDPSGEIKMALNVANPAKGRLLFRSVGCLGCHTRGDVPGVPEDRVAPDLSGLGAKRSVSWVAAYLERPKKGGASRHRADLRLTADDAAHLAAYLVGDPPAAPAPPDRDRPEGDVAKGKALAVRLRCAACHEIPGLARPSTARPLVAGARPDAGCLADPSTPAAGPVPRFDLSDDQRLALREFVARLPEEPSPTGPETFAADTVRRSNCLGCHVRDGQGGTTLGPQLAASLGDDSELGRLKGTLTPPNLSAVGDKLRPDYLGEAVRGRAPTARPWLSVRMPAMTFEPGEAESIAEYFRGRDRMTSSSEPADAPTRPDAETFEAAVALLGQRGFGCVNCHVLAGKIPPGGEPETLGPDLALAHRRMDERYFRRWIGNPQRVIPGTPMPQFLQPVATVAGPLDRQLSTIWQLLGSTRVGEAAAQGTREILKREGDRPLIVRDMVLLPDAPDTEYTPRGLAIGLKNDHSLLFDTGQLTWLSAWRGGFLSRTKSGRLWEWHPEGERLWVAARRQPTLVFLGRDGKIAPPGEVRGRFGHFAEVDFEGPDVRLTYDLNPPRATGGGPIEVSETIRPTTDGWERAIRVVSGAPADDLRPALVVQAPVGPLDEAIDGSCSFSWRAGNDRVTLVVQGTTIDPTPVPGDPTAHLFLIRPSATSGGTARVRLSVRTGP